MQRKDHITQFIEDIQEVRLALLKPEYVHLKKTVEHLENAISSLKNYKVEQGVFIPKPPPVNNSSRTKTTQKKQIIQEPSLSQQITECGSGKHWVRKPLKNGALGYCRKNPQRKKYQSSNL